MDDFNFDTLQTVSDVLAGVFGVTATVLNALVGFAGTAMGWIVSGGQWVYDKVSGLIAK